MRSQASSVLSRRQSTVSIASGRKSFVRRAIADHKVKARTAAERLTYARNRQSRDVVETGFRARVLALAPRPP